MAKTVRAIDLETGKEGGGKQRRVKQVDWPVTMNNTRGKRLARKLWG